MVHASHLGEAIDLFNVGIHLFLFRRADDAHRLGDAGLSKLHHSCGPTLNETMSLKAFHLVFVTVTVLASLFVSMLGYRGWQDSQSSTDLAFAIGGAAGVVIMLVYGVYFLKKLKKISYL